MSTDCELKSRMYMGETEMNLTGIEFFKDSPTFSRGVSSENKERASFRSLS